MLQKTSGRVRSFSLEQQQVHATVRKLDGTLDM